MTHRCRTLAARRSELDRKPFLPSGYPGRMTPASLTFTCRIVFPITCVTSFVQLHAFMTQPSYRSERDAMHWTQFPIAPFYRTGWRHAWPHAVTTSRTSIAPYHPRAMTCLSNVRRPSTSDFSRRRASLLTGGTVRPGHSLQGCARTRNGLLLWPLLARHVFAR